MDYISEVGSCLVVHVPYPIIYDAGIAECTTVDNNIEASSFVNFGFKFCFPILEGPEKIKPHDFMVLGELLENVASDKTFVSS